MSVPSSVTCTVDCSIFHAMDVKLLWECIIDGLCCKVFTGNVSPFCQTPELSFDKPHSDFYFSVGENYSNIIHDS